MRTIERSTAFKRDYKRESKSKYCAVLDVLLKEVLVALATDQLLATHWSTSATAILNHCPPRPVWFAISNE